MPDATSYKQTKQGIIPRHQLLPMESEAVDRAIAFITEGKADQISSETILAMHHVAFGSIFEWAGSWRTGDVTFGDLEGPSHFQVPILIQEFCKDLDERLKHLPPQSDTDAFMRELVLLLAWTQHRFVVIHPFRDYNGRIARLITNAVLHKLGMPMTELKADSEADRKRYIKALRKADKLDFAELELILYDAIKEALQKNL